MRAVGYIRVSTVEQADEGHGLDAQKRAIAGEAQRRGWELAGLASDTGSAATITKRPGFERVLDQLDEGEYEALLVARLDRAWRSVGDFAQTMDRAQKRGWVIVLLDPAVDMGTPFGRAMAGVAAVFAQLERELISQRTSDAIRAAYASGKATPPQPLVVGPVVDRMLELRGRGLSYRRIARALTVEGFASPRGGAWHHSTVVKALDRSLAAQAAVIDAGATDAESAAAALNGAARDSGP